MVFANTVSLRFRTPTALPDLTPTNQAHAPVVFFPPATPTGPASASPTSRPTSSRPSSVQQFSSRPSSQLQRRSANTANSTDDFFGHPRSPSPPQLLPPLPRDVRSGDSNAFGHSDAGFDFDQYINDDPDGRSFGGSRQSTGSMPWLPSDYDSRQHCTPFNILRFYDFVDS